MAWIRHDGAILTMGAALVDLLIQEQDAYVEKFGPKGGMTLVDSQVISEMLSQTTASVEMASGGSSCNTGVGLARLGVPAQFMGRIGTDATGDFFAKSLDEAGVQTKLSKVQDATGQVLSVITPDAQRTMFTSLGASAGLIPEDLERIDWTALSLIHLEVYLAYNPDFFRAVLAKAKAHQVPVALDLSSFQVVEHCRPLLEEAIEIGLEWLIANEDEGAAMAGSTEPEKILRELSRFARGAVLKLGAEGAWIRAATEEVHVPTTPVQAIDTTGAGDSWAAGFYAGLWKGWTLEKSAQLGHRVAGEVVQVVGAGLTAEAWDKLRLEA
jgi:sugar/nucleoside kinase (ribokinase family)